MIDLFCARRSDSSTITDMRKLSLMLASSMIFWAALAYADQVDCSGVPHWNSDHRYKKGDRVWHHEGGNVYHLFACDKDSCVGAGSNEPHDGSGPWKYIGSCKSGTAH